MNEEMFHLIDFSLLDRYDEIELNTRLHFNKE